jgi:hypothetical protein
MRAGKNIHVSASHVSILLSSELPYSRARASMTRLEGMEVTCERQSPWGVLYVQRPSGSYTLCVLAGIPYYKLYDHCQILYTGTPSAR